MSKFKVGDEVKIVYTGNHSTMFSLRGTTTSITEVAGERSYYTKGNSYLWGDNWLELVSVRKFKVGDKVRFRPELVVGKRYGHLEFLGAMDANKGKTLTVKDTSYSSCRVEEDRLLFALSWEMLEAAPTEEKVEELPPFKEGDKVVLRPDLAIGQIYGSYVFISAMEPYLGKVLTIKCVFSKSNSVGVEGTTLHFSTQMLTRATVSEPPPLPKPSTKPAFKVGDPVRLKERLIPGVDYEGIPFGVNLIPYRGGVFTVKSIVTNVDKSTIFELNGRNVNFYVSAQMLEPIIYPNFRRGDMVRVRRDLSTKEEYRGSRVNGYMEAIGGNCVVIDKPMGDNKYRVLGDHYCWTVEMFEPLVLANTYIESSSHEPLTDTKLSVAGDIAPKRKLEVGQHVQVRRDLKVGTFYGKMDFGANMDSSRGKVKRITEVDPSDNSFRLDGGVYWFTEEMLAESLSSGIKTDIDSIEADGKLEEYKPITIEMIKESVARIAGHSGPAPVSPEIASPVSWLDCAHAYLESSTAYRDRPLGPRPTPTEKILQEVITIKKKSKKKSNLI